MTWVSSAYTAHKQYKKVNNKLIVLTKMVYKRLFYYSFSASGTEGLHSQRTVTVNLKVNCKMHIKFQQEKIKQIDDLPCGVFIWSDADPTNSFCSAISNAANFCLTFIVPPTFFNLSASLSLPLSLFSFAPSSLSSHLLFQTIPLGLYFGDLDVNVALGG